MCPPEVSEEWLRHVWQHQLFDASRLHTREGKAVSILFPGTPNRDGGPDFTSATLRIGQTTFHGDVELHVDAAEWQAHRHHLDPHYNAVILHVVLAASGDVTPAVTSTRRALPLLVLHPFLDERLHTAWKEAFIDTDSRRRTARIPCNTLNEVVPAETLLHMLDRLATERLETRVRKLEERLKQLIDEQRMTVREPSPRYYGNPDDIPAPPNDYTHTDFASRALWDQLLYEGIMEGMGYAKNRVPFRALSHNLKLTILRDFDIADRQTTMALLFGAAGLLPSPRDIADKESRAYVRPLRRRWKELRSLLRIPLLHEADWLFFRLRPTNFPTARLASICFLLPSLFDSDGLRRLIGIFNDERWTVHERIIALNHHFDYVPDDFWMKHVTFGEEGRQGGARLGRDRIIDLLINTVIPVALLYGRIFSRPALLNHAREVYHALPASQDNIITRTVRKQLLRVTIPPSSAWMQQGMIQLYKFFCTRSRCRDCDIGAMCLPAVPR